MIAIERSSASPSTHSASIASDGGYAGETTESVLRRLDSNPAGLTTDEAERRLLRYGYNRLEEARKISPLLIFISQFKSLVMIILIVATGVSWLLGEWIESSAILTVLLLIAVFGFLQEYKAEQAIRALMHLASPKASVLRDRKRTEVDAENLVPGDVLILETGSIVPADARLIESVNLYVQESALTGESESVKKQTDPVDPNAALAERGNTVFASTIVTQGRGRAVVTATGMATEIGKIASLIQQTPEEMTPLQVKLDQLGNTLGGLTVAICLIVFVAEILNNRLALDYLANFDWLGFFREAKDAFLISIALAVAAISEGLPAVVTISLALGTRRMLERNALVRRLSSVETLGETTVICSDKTGTLTMNQMTVEKLYVDHRILTVSGSGYERVGRISENGEPVDSRRYEKLLLAGLLNNDAEFKNGGIAGDPTEGALLVSAAKAGMDKRRVESEYPRIDEIGFTSERKMMTTLHARPDAPIAFSKGAAEMILERCTAIEIDGVVRPLEQADRTAILEAQRAFSEEGLRVLAFAYRYDTRPPREQELILLGLQAMRDPPRPGVREALERCRSAGIKVLMITGDHVVTAKAIGAEIGLVGQALSGRELDAIDDLSEMIDDVAIYARVNPEHKLKIVDALRRKGHHIVAMTGDGVNDAPALKKSDIGVAMGVCGSDVSKEASDVILIDDNFASIVGAVEEGRKIYDNIKNYVQYLLSSNMAEVSIIFIAILLELPLPLLAIQLLLMNLVTDGAPAIALSLEPAQTDIMRRQPRKPGDKILSLLTAINLLVLAVWMTVVTLAVYVYFLDQPCLDCRDVNDYARTIAFTTLVMLEMFNVMNCKSEHRSLFSTGLFNNRWLWWAIVSSIAIQVVVVQWLPYELFRTTPLTLNDWLLTIALGGTVLVVGEILKLIYRKGAQLGWLPMTLD
ncbi:MAG: calcium-translocating P-type ATPase, SERCA-type [Methylomicrobium sp.]